MFELAQASTPDIDLANPITQIVGYAGVVGALIWYMYYNTAVAIPRIVAEHKEAQKILTDKHDQYVKYMTEVHIQNQQLIVKEFTNTLAQEREIRRSELGAFRELLKSGEACRYGNNKG